MSDCACGRPLHYSNPELQRMVQQFVDLLGECVLVRQIESGRAWMVPRHFIALHGIHGWDLHETAARYGFEEVTGRAEFTEDFPNQGDVL